MFLFDCCSGESQKVHEWRDYEFSSDDDETDNNDGNDDKGKSITSKNGQDTEKEDKGELWQRDEDNPDFRLTTIHAANQGFQSKMSNWFLCYKWFYKFND